MFQKRTRRLREYRNLPKITQLVGSSSSPSLVHVVLHEDKTRVLSEHLWCLARKKVQPQCCFPGRQRSPSDWGGGDFFHSTLNLSHCDRSHASDSPVSPGCQDTCLFSESRLPDTCQRAPVALPSSFPSPCSFFTICPFSSFFLHHLFSQSGCNTKLHIFTD